MKQAYFLHLRSKMPLILFLFLLSATLMNAPGYAQTPPGSYGQQVGTAASQYPTLDEQRILQLHGQYLASKQAYGDAYQTLYLKELLDNTVRYMKDACKEQVCGDWRIRELGDEVNISYDDQYKVFVGRVIRIVEFDPNWVRPGYILFKVYFPKQNFGSSFPTTPMNLEYLRSTYKKCTLELEGVENSFKRQGDRMVAATSPIRIIPQPHPSLMIYQTQKNYALIRIR